MIKEERLPFSNSKWIWSNDPMRKYSCVIFRKTFSFGTERPPARAICRAASDSHYYLYVNGKAVVWCGTLNRGANNYYDEFDIAPYLVKGDNVIIAYCMHYGSDGRDMVIPERAGFIFESDDLKIYSDDTFTAYDNRAYKTPKESNCCYAGDNINYDASLEGQIQNLQSPTFNSSLFAPATIVCANYPGPVMGILVPRPIPMEKISPQPTIARPKKTTDQFDGDVYTIDLPKEMRVTPYFEVTGNGQEKILIYTDRSDCQGTFGDEKSVYRAHTVEYITKPTINIFEALLPMTGEQLIFSMPHTVKVLKLGYREIGYDAKPTIDFDTSDDTLNTLFEKAQNTLYACMGSTLMDTPERERTFWLGDGSIAARALYLSYFNANGLVRKAMTDVVDGKDGDCYYSCVPGNLPIDIPAHGLIALSEYGIFAQYHNYIGEKEFFKSEYNGLCDYLMLWEMTEHGVALRDGNRRWYDNLYNVDEPLVENALYYSACKFLRAIGAEIGNDDYEETFSDRMDNISDYIESCWDGLGYVSREDGYDDRANALIALCGVVPQERVEAVVRILSSCYSASPFLEWTVIEALSKLGRRDLALKRFKSRYAILAENDDSTLGEDFNGYGSHCQAYQTSVISELVCVFCGIDVKDGGSKVMITPDFTALKDFHCALTLKSGVIDVKCKYTPTKTEIIIDNATSAKVSLDIAPEHIGRKIERKLIALNKGRNKFVI